LTIFNAQNQTAAGVINTIAGVLARHRAVLNDINDLYAWTSGISAADLEALSGAMPSGDAGDLLAAVADAHAEYLIHTTGQAPSSYPQVTGTPYVYAASQVTVIGSLIS
jgi:hypothetical protein